MWKHVWTKGLTLAVFALVLLLGTGANAACISWSDARGVIAKNGLLKPGTVRKRTMRRDGEVLGINLCRSRGKYIYRLTVLDKKKRARTITVDARSGKTIGGRAKGRGRKKKKLEDQIINQVKKNLRRHGINYY